MWHFERPTHIDPSPDWNSTITGREFTAKSFMVPVETAEIEAMILLPNDFSRPSGAVVFTGGSGDGLFQNYRAGFLKTYLQDIFLPRNIAVVYANKRGMGASTGNWKNNTIEGRAADVIAVADAVRDMPEVDAARVGYAGHSQGGWVVVRAAVEDPRTAFVLNFMGPLRKPWDQFENMWHNIYHCEGMTPEEVEKAYQRKASITRIGDAIGALFPIGQIGFDAKFFAYETKGLLAQVSVPLLAVFGGNDFLVDGPANEAFLAAEFNAAVPPNLEVRTIDGLSHAGFQIPDMCDETFAPRSMAVSPELIGAIEDWLARIGYREKRDS